jgi:hypothetical protein
VVPRTPNEFNVLLKTIYDGGSDATFLQWNKENKSNDENSLKREKVFREFNKSNIYIHCIIKLLVFYFEER